MGDSKAIFLKIHYFHVLTSLLERKFNADFRIGFKKFQTISEGPKISIELPWEMTEQIFKTVWWPKFEQVTKKVPTPRT